MKTKQSLPFYELELYKDLYETENEYRHKQSDKAFKSITVIASFVGAVLWLIFKYLKIYKTECCYLQCINFILLICCSSLMLACVIIFFRVLYGYHEKRPDPNEIEQLLEEYKSQTEDESVIIAAMNDSLIISYRDAAINNSSENEKHSVMFGYFYLIIFVEMFLLIVTFLIEILA
jgi:uncharacterized protein with PQ loop repeat